MNRNKIPAVSAWVDRLWLEIDKNFNFRAIIGVAPHLWQILTKEKREVVLKHSMAKSN